MDVSGKTKIWAKEFNGRTAYSRTISSREFKDGQQGDWIREYESVQFPKGAVIPNGSIVELKGFEAVYKTKDAVKRKLVVQEYNVLEHPTYEEHAQQDAFEGFKAVDDDIPF